jgi:hypothetical protein
MLSQVILSLTKESIAVGVVLLFDILLLFVFPAFALMQKVEPKNQCKPKWLRLFCRPRTAAVTIEFIFHLLQFMKHVSLCLTTYSKDHAFPSGVTNGRCIPLSFSYSKVFHFTHAE